MRVLVLILAILVFRQAVTICGSKIRNEHEIYTSISKQSDCSKSVVGHSCCSKKAENKKSSDNHDDTHKCNCVGSATAIIEYYVMHDAMIFNEIKVAEKRAISPTYHPYDFHAKISYPPQLI